MAAGISISAERVDAFSEAFEKCAAESIRPEDLIPQKRFDDEVLLEELTLETVRELERFSPCGAGNPEPLLLACGIRALKPRIVGEKHLQFTAGQGGYSHPCIAFGMASLLPELPRELDLLFSPAVNEWRGRKTVQLVVRDLRPAQSRLS